MKNTILQLENIKLEYAQYKDRISSILENCKDCSERSIFIELENMVYNFYKHIEILYDSIIDACDLDCINKDDCEKYEKCPDECKFIKSQRIIHKNYK